MWIRVDRSLKAHRKLRQLKQVLNLPAVQLGGHLVWLWLECLDQAVDGELEGWTAADVEHHAEWEGTPGALCDALCDVGFLERTPLGFRVHDWWEYAGSLRAAKRQRKYRETKRKGREPGQNGSAPDHEASPVTSPVTHDGRTDVTDVTDVTDQTQSRDRDVTDKPEGTKPTPDGMISAREVEQLACDRGWTPWMASSTRSLLVELAPLTPQEWEAAAVKTDAGADHPGLPYCLSLIRTGRKSRTRTRENQNDGSYGHHRGSETFSDGDQPL